MGYQLHDDDFPFNSVREAVFIDLLLSLLFPLVIVRGGVGAVEVDDVFRNDLDGGQLTRGGMFGQPDAARGALTQGPTQPPWANPVFDFALARGRLI